jgi:hypothetical protein
VQGGSWLWGGVLIDSLGAMTDEHQRPCRFESSESFESLESLESLNPTILFGGAVCNGLNEFAPHWTNPDQINSRANCVATFDVFAIGPVQTQPLL